MIFYHRDAAANHFFLMHISFQIIHIPLQLPYTISFHDFSFGPVASMHRNTSGIYHFLSPTGYSTAENGKENSSVIWEGFKESTSVHGIPHVDRAPGQWSQIYRCSRSVIGYSVHCILYVDTIKGQWLQLSRQQLSRCSRSILYTLMCTAYTAYRV